MDVMIAAVGILFAMQGTVAGTVRDGATGTPLAGAVVALPDAERTSVTGADGRYALHDVPSGPQHLTIRRIGYASRSLHALVAPEGSLRIDVLLRAVPTRLPTVDVRAPVAIRGFDVDDNTAFPDRGISMAAARNHPLLSEPDAFQALAGSEAVVRPESPSGVHVRGGASDHTAYVLDGIPVLNPYHAAGVFGAWNPDAISHVQLSAADPLVTHPHSLSGTIAGETRAPGNRVRGEGGVSTTQARATVDGPVGMFGAAYLVSLRTGFPGIVAPGGEASYVRGELGDLLAKIETPLFGGALRLLGYSNENELSVASAPEDEGSPLAKAPRHYFGWTSQSVGGEWSSRAFASTMVRLSAWNVLGHADAFWRDAAPVEMTSRRRDHGFLAALQRSGSVVGVRVEQIETSYRVAPKTAMETAMAVAARTAVVSVFAQRTMTWRTVETGLGISVATMSGVYPSPRVSLRWHPSERLTVTASYARTHQFAQSLRNAESVVGSVFPADLHVSAGAAGIPVARSDQVVAAAEYRPSAKFRMGGQAYARTMHGLVVVAPHTTGPFSMTAFAVGTGAARGASADVSVRGTRYGLTAGYGWQHVRLQLGNSSYAPDFATAHLLDAGAIVFPTPTTSIRLGATGGVGRRTSIVTGAFEWESCNLIDQGCEFAGSPHNESGPAGAATLPSYLRVDLGVRKHWHIDLAGRDVMLAAFGTITNVFGRRNLLTYTRNPPTGEITAIEMRPLAPLVIGVDWRF